jgi:hypothetical protein
MTGLEFYQIIRSTFLDCRVACFVNPLKNYPDEFTNVQFVLPDKRICAPWHPDALEVVVADPLAGPFYSREICGWWGFLWNFPENKNMYSVGVTVTLGGGKNVDSEPIIIKDGGNVIEKLKGICVGIPYTEVIGLPIENYDELVLPETE